MRKAAFRIIPFQDWTLTIEKKGVKKKGRFSSFVGFFFFLFHQQKKQQNNNLSPSSPSPQTPELPHHQGRWRTTLEKYICKWEGASNRSGTSILQIQNHANTHPVVTENSGLVPSYHRGNTEFRRKHLALSKVDTFPAEEMLDKIILCA